MMPTTYSISNLTSIEFCLGPGTIPDLPVTRFVCYY